MVSERSRFPTSRPGTQCRAGRQNTRNDKDLNRSRPQAFPDRAGNAQTQQRRDFPGFPVSPLYRERVSIGNAPPPSTPMAGRARKRRPSQTTRVLPGPSAMRGARARRFATVRVQTGVCTVCGLHPPASTRSKGEQGNPETNGATATAITPFPVRPEDHC